MAMDAATTPTTESATASEAQTLREKETFTATTRTVVVRHTLVPYIHPLPAIAFARSCSTWWMLTNAADACAEADRMILQEFVTWWTTKAGNGTAVSPTKRGMKAAGKDAKGVGVKGGKKVGKVVKSGANAATLGRVIKKDPEMKSAVKPESLFVLDPRRTERAVSS